MAATSVASTTSSTTLLAASTEPHRKVLIENSDANRLHVLLDDGTASTTNFSFSLAQNENAEIPLSYTGVIKGIWAADGTGFAHITVYQGS